MLAARAPVINGYVLFLSGEKVLIDTPCQSIKQQKKLFVMSDTHNFFRENLISLMSRIVEKDNHLIFQSWYFYIIFLYLLLYTFYNYDEITFALKIYTTLTFVYGFE